MVKGFSIIVFLIIFMLTNSILISERKDLDKFKGSPFQTLFSKPSQTNFTYTPLIDFVGNWSNLTIIPIKDINFTIIRLNSNRSLFGAPTFTLVGNGLLGFHLSAHNYSFELSRNKSLLFHWKDFGGTRYADYIGVSLGLRLGNGEEKTLFIAKHASGIFHNTSNTLLFFARPMIELYKYWEKWGVEVATLIDYFGTEKITLTTVNYLHNYQVGSEGPRSVEYTQPLLVDSLEREENSKGAFLDIQSGLDEQIENSTQDDSTLSLSEVIPPTFTDDLLYGLILVTITALFLMILGVYLFSRFMHNTLYVVRSLESNTFSACLGLFSEEGLTVQLKSTNCPFEEIHILSMLQYVTVLHRQRKSEEKLYGPFPVKQPILPNFTQIERYFISFDFLVTDESVQDSEVIKNKGKVPAILLLFYPREFDVILTHQKREVIDLFKAVVPSSVLDFTPEVLNDLIRSLVDLLSTPK